MYDLYKSALEQISQHRIIYTPVTIYARAFPIKIKSSRIVDNSWRQLAQ